MQTGTSFGVSSVDRVLRRLAIYETMRALIPDVSTLVLGLAASTASLIIVRGKNIKRVAYPHARVMIRQPWIAHFSAPPDRMLLEAEEMFQLRSTIVEIYVKNTTQSVHGIQQDLERDHSMYFDILLILSPYLIYYFMENDVLNLYNLIKNHIDFCIAYSVFSLTCIQNIKKKKILSKNGRYINITVGHQKDLVRLTKARKPASLIKLIPI